MTSSTKQILIIGATGDLGEQFTRRLHAQGKSIIATGRRLDRLQTLQSSLPGLVTTQWDVADLPALSFRASSILKEHPDIDTVFIAAGIMKFFSFFNPSSVSDREIISEINTDFTSRVLLARHFLPHLQAIAHSGRQANLMIMGSGLAFIPLGFFPAYCATQAAVHNLTISMRQQVGNQPDESVKKNLHIIQVAAPHIDTAFDAECREAVKEASGGHGGVHPMPLDEYMESAMEGLATVDEDGRPLKEIAVGFSKMGVDLWRGSFGKAMDGMGLKN